MARARNIKPGFAKNEDLAECSVWARLLFALLPTLADREGRLEDRPKRIKGELFAFDSIEVEPMLVELAKHGFIERYAVEGRGLIQIIAFHKHQHPHFKEPPSTLPPHPSLRLDGDGKWVKPEADPQLNGAKAPDKPEALTPRSDISSRSNPEVQRGSNPADSGALIPEHGFRSPDSGALIPEQHGSPVVARTTPEPRGNRNGTPPIAAAKASATTRGTRLPAGWALPKPWGEWALAELPGWTADSVRLEAARFTDHWHAKAGKDAAKLDWLATWRNWCRNARPALTNGRTALHPIDTATRNAEAKRLLGFGGPATPATAKETHDA